MKELDLLVENYFTPALDATDILRLVEQVMEEEIYYRDPEDETYRGPISSVEKVADEIINVVKRKFPDNYEDADLIFQQGKTTLVFTNFGSLAKRHDAIVALEKEGYLSDPKIKKGRGLYDSATTNFVDKRKNGTYNPIKVRFNSGTLTAEEKISNRGDVFEGLLGVALFISLRDGVVTKQRIIKTLEELDSQADTSITSTSKKRISKTLESLSSAKKASEGVLVKLKVALNIGNFKDLVSSEKRGLLSDEYANVLRYSNSDYFRNFRDTVIFDRANPPRNSVGIGVIGAEEQTESKADLRLFKDGKPLSAQSLKYGSRQLGQVGGRDAENVFAWFNKIFGTQLPQDVEDQYRDVLRSECDDKFKERFYRATSAMFAIIYQDAKGKLSSNDYQEELIKALRASSVGDEPNIDLLNFEKNKFRLLDFEQIEELSPYLNLDIDFQPSPGVIPDKGGYPELIVFDPRQSVVPNKESRLFRVRPKYEANKCYPRFYLEYGDLVDNILTKVNESKLKE